MSLAERGRHRPDRPDARPRVLVTGASGFLGGRVARALAARGVEVVAGLRDPARACPLGFDVAVGVDFVRDAAAAVWLPRLEGVDAVVNAVGILRERGAQTFEALHVRAPLALGAACAERGVKLVQISALGADAGARSRYHLSKLSADEGLLAAVPRAVVAQPSLVYGEGGASARLFTLLASLPVVPLPGCGAARIQPIHVDDLVAALVALVESDACIGCRVPLVGPEPLTWREFLTGLRGALGLAPAPVVTTPDWVLRAAARSGEWSPAMLLDRETLAMLARDNVAPSAATAALLGRAPRPVREFVPPAQAPAVLARARLDWLLPILALALAVMWIASGWVSLFAWPRADSMALLARVGFAGAAATAALHLGALVDLALGIAVLVCRHGRWLWLAQLAVVAVYTLIITIWLPEQWLHPYGPVLKNLPIMASLVLLAALEPVRR